VSCGHPCANQHARIRIFAETELAPLDANDARRAALNHFESGAGAQAEFFETTNLFGSADELANFGNLAAAKNGERHQIGHQKL
jgi:hypothetical protein